MKKFILFLLAFFRPGIVQPMPPGLVADPSALYGLIQLMQNLIAYSQMLISGSVASVSNINLTVAQLGAGVLRLTGTASGGFTITMPSTASILSVLKGVPVDGSFSKRITIINDNTGQTGTLTIGDSSTTLTGTMTLATNTVRDFILTVTGAGTIGVQNLGTKAI
jgi:hypothetical protein